MTSSGQIGREDRRKSKAGAQAEAGVEKEERSAQRERCVAVTVPTVGMRARALPSSPEEGQSPQLHPGSGNLPMIISQVGEKPK